MLDKKNKGGKSLIIRCASALKNHSSCPFYYKLRRNMRDQRWYVSGTKETRHTCGLEENPVKLHLPGKMPEQSRLPCDSVIMSTRSVKRKFEP